MEWVEVHPEGDIVPGPRVFHTCGLIGKQYMCLFGGESKDETLYNDVCNGYHGNIISCFFLLHSSIQHLELVIDEWECSCLCGCVAVWLCGLCGLCWMDGLVIFSLKGLVFRYKNIGMEQLGWNDG
jgi:hypothetical protein